MSDQDLTPTEEPYDNVDDNVVLDNLAASGDVAVPAEAGETAASDGAGDRHQAERRVLRRRTIQFVVVFLLVVLGLLAGYESIKNTRTNDWYLLRVATSTRSLLSLVGYSCTLGDVERYKGKEESVRKALEALARGDSTSLLDPLPPKPGPELTPWEAWFFQSAAARELIRQTREQVRTLEKTADELPGGEQKLERARKKLAGLTMRDRGPLVNFILRPGPARRLADAEASLEQLISAGTADGAPRAAKLREEIDSLQQQAAVARNAPEDPATRELRFNFVLVPDCGAIPSIAIFVAAVLAFPALWWKKLAGIVAGVFTLYWVNALRLMCLATLGAWNNGGAIFKFAHEYVWQGIYIIFVVVVWIMWVEFVVRRRKACA